MTVLEGPYHEVSAPLGNILPNVDHWRGRLPSCYSVRRYLGGKYLLVRDLRRVVAAADYGACIEVFDIRLLLLAQNILCARSARPVDIDVQCIFS